MQESFLDAEWQNPNGVLVSVMKPYFHTFSVYPGKLNSYGFTLVELVVTLAIAAILATIAVPAFTSTLESLRARRATESMVAGLYNAKSEAIKQNAFVRVVFKTSNSGATWCYGLTKATTCDCTTANSCSLNDAERVVSNTQFKGIAATVSPNDSTFHFNPLRGTVNKGNVKFTSDGQSFQSRAVISGKGRITTCSDSGTGYMGAFKEC